MISLEPSRKPVASGSPPKVTVIITTYNHERFIKEAIDGVLMQETNFDYDVVILEDCSTDRTRDIVIAYQKAHPGKIRLVLSEVNKCDNSAFMRAVQEAPGPYIAILDGDDYWTCRQKLQKQVDYLDQHPECTLCTHNVSFLNDDGNEELENGNPPHPMEISSVEDLFEGCFIQCCSVMFRQGVISEFPAWYVDDQSADWSLYIMLAQHGKVGYINEVMGVYRVHAGGFWTGSSQAERMERLVQFYENLHDYLPVQYSDRIRTLLARSCYRIAIEFEQTGDPHVAANWFRKCLSWEPDIRRILFRVAGGNEARLVVPPQHSDVVRIAIERSETAATFDIQLNQPHLKVQAGHRYRVAFQARADGPRTIFAGVALAHEPWTGLGLYQKIELTSQWQSFDQEFVAISDEDNARIHFDVGGSGISVELSSVSLLNLADGLPVEPQLPLGRGGEAEGAEMRNGRVSSEREPLIEEPGPGIGEVQFGSLGRLTPISRNWGLDRGLPVDRYYIRRFLGRSADAIHGRVLEVGDNSYTTEFGGDRVTRSDVLHVTEGNSRATIIGDLTRAPQIPSDAFDCIILTQTLQFIYDVRAAIRTLHRILKPGGILLTTFPGISQTYDSDWGNDWCWSFTKISARRLFEECFLPADVQMQAFGNVLAAISFLHGLSAEELTRQQLDYSEPGYEVTIAVRAVKS